MNSVRAKFDEIHADLEANVTKIYRRRDLLTAFDLVVHSVIQFRFQGDIVRKGWVEGLVIGDTRCGKSETVDRLINHYRVGEMVTGENATYAGLIGGMQQTQKTWSITWGKFPLNDRRFLAVDELSGLQEEAISRMSGVRSSGVAEIIKIQTERTLARVRVLWLSNPRGKRPLAAFNSGIDAIMDLIGHPEDVARFDFGLTVATAEVPLNVINSKARPKVAHQYSSDLCNRLIYWAWSRKPDQVVWAPGAEDAVLAGASWLAEKFAPPLVEGAEQRIKVARLAVSAAARVFSCTPDHQSILVTRDHVQFVIDYLDEIYCKPSMSFDLYARAKHAETRLDHEEEIAARFAKYSDDLIGLLTDASTFAPSDIQDFASCDRDEAADLVSFLVRRRAIKKGRFGYYKLPAFIKFLRHHKKGSRGAGESVPF